MKRIKMKNLKREHTCTPGVSLQSWTVASTVCQSVPAAQLLVWVTWAQARPSSSHTVCTRTPPGISKPIHHCVNCALKELHWDSEALAHLQLWNIATRKDWGNDKNLLSGIYRCIDCLQYHQASPIWSTVKVEKWFGLNVNSWQISFCGSVGQEMWPWEGECRNSSLKIGQIYMEHSFVGWVETSAKENVNLMKPPGAWMPNRQIQNLRKHS